MGDSVIDKLALYQFYINKKPGCMRTLKCFLILKAVFLLVLSTYVYGVHEHEITVAISETPPYAIIDKNNQPKGLVLDIMNELSTTLSFNVSAVACPFPRCLKLLKSGKIDVIGNIIKTPEREVYLDFIEPAYMELNSSFVFYALANSDISVNRYEELRRKRIGVTRGAVHFRKFDIDPSLILVPVLSEKLTFEMLLKNRVDIVISVEETAEYVIKTQGLPREKFKKLNYRYSDKILGYTAFSRKYKDQQLLAQIKLKMRELQRTGRLTQLVAPYNLPPVTSQ